MKILAQNYKSGELEMLEVPMMTSIKGLFVKTVALIGNPDPIAFAQEFFGFEGLDAVIIVASVDRGNREELQSTIAALTLKEASPIDFKSLVAATFAVEDSLSTGEANEINLGAWGIH
jgi:hypothetical protein